MPASTDTQQKFSLPDKFRQFQTHWENLRGELCVPQLGDFLDKPIPELQPWICILDAPANGVLNVRLLGTGIVSFFGVDTTGSNFLDLVPAAIRSRYLRLSTEISRVPCGIFHKTISSSSQGRELELMAMSLPFERTCGEACGIWLVEITRTPQYNEMGKHVERIMFEQWIDLGHGVPT